LTIFFRFSYRELIVKGKKEDPSCGKLIAGSLAPNVFHSFQGYADAIEVKVSLGNVGRVAIMGDLGGGVFARLRLTVGIRICLR
jgi:hypothetical protein